MTKCDKCLHRCKSECCTWVPMKQEFLETHQDKFQRPVYGVAEIEGGPKCVYAITHIETKETKIDGKMQLVNGIDKQKQICPFLTSKYRCAVYADRPNICRAFGTDNRPDHPFTCHFHLGKSYHTPNLPEDVRMANAIKYIDDYKKYPGLIKELTQ